MLMSRTFNTLFIIALFVTLVLSSDNCSAQKPKLPPAQPKSIKPTYTKKEIPQGKLINLVAKVGSGGITKADYDFYLLKFANKNRKGVGALSAEDRKAALNMAIDDELV